MDPLTAVGLAANVLAFIDLGYSLVSSAVEVHNSVEGTTAETADLLSTITRLENVSGDLKHSASLGHGAGHAGLHGLAQGCYSLSQELLRILRSLRADKRGSPRQSLAVAWRTWRKQPEIGSIRRRLDEYRSQILLEINLISKSVTIIRGLVPKANLLSLDTVIT